MEDAYLISILGRQTVNGEQDEVEVTTLGRYTEKNGKRYIVYKEYEDGDDLQHARTSILKVEGDKRVTLMRSGGDATRLILENGKRHLCQYQTGIGALMVGVFTHSLHADLDEKGGRLSVQYTLDVNSALASVNEIYITVKEAGKRPAERPAPESQFKLS